MLWDLLKLAGAALFLPYKVHVLPRHLQLDITTSCNLNCRMCYAKKVVTDGEKHRHLTIEQFNKIFDSLHPASVNLAASGEPLLNPDLFEIIAYARKNKCITIIATNFVAADTTLIGRLVDSGPDIMKISIDGATKNVYERVRGPYYDRLVSNLKELVARLDKRTDSRLKVRFDYVMLKTNAEDIVRILEFARQMKVSHIFYRICDPRGWSSVEKDELLRGSFSAVREKLREAVRVSGELGMTTNAADLLSRSDEWRFIYEDPDAVPDTAGKPVCFLPWSQLFLSVLGDASYCCSIYPSHDGSLGNVFDDSSQELWNNARWQSVRRLFRRKENYKTFEGCRYCTPMSRSHLLGLVRMFPGFVRKKI